MSKISGKITSHIVRALLLAGIGLAAAASAQPGPATLALDAKVTILQNPNETGAVRRATEDLQNDLQKVFGVKPRIVTRPEDAGALTIMIGESSEIPANLRPKGLAAPESFSISVVPGKSRIILLTGADMRGTMYAIYQFSQDYLGVDPMYYWTDKQPVRRASIAIPASLSRAFPAPLFKYRGFFINDEDQLTGWAPGEKTDKTGISLAVMNKIYETVLRLKGNMIVPGTWDFATAPQMKLVGERGLILTQHHAMPLGVNVARWPANVPYNYTTHPEIIERAWKNAVASYDPHQEILWAVGLRGLSDSAYSTMDPSVVGNDKAQGALIHKAIVEQMKIVRAVHPDAKFVTDFWMEGARLVHEGYLQIPPGVTPVWADTGYGLVQDNGTIAAGQGVYYHVAMLNGRANQLSEMVPVSRIYSEFSRFIKAGATQYMLVNTSDIRAVSMTTKAVMDVAWGGVPAGGVSATGQYYRDWSAYEFGDKAAPALAKIYAEYFAAFSHIPAGQHGAGDEYGDQIYHSEAQQMLLGTMVSPPYYALAAQDPKWMPVHILGLGLEPGYWHQIGPDYVAQTAAREIKICGDAQARWDAVWKDAVAAESLVTPARRPYYEMQMLTMVAINRDSNRILYLVSKAVMDYRAGDKAKARAEAEQTLPAFDEIHRLESKAEYGKWKNWYRGEWLDGIDHTRDLVGDFLHYLDDPTMTLPLPVLSDGWQGYYHIMHYEGDQTVDVK
ncbi:MAG TPA: glycosyl hydrolase 115 family protein [Rhizomicrobium sp.]